MQTQLQIKEKYKPVFEHLGKEIGTEAVAALEEHELSIAEELKLLDSTLPRIIGMCGAAGAGKDTVSLFLSYYGYQRIAFADALKIEAYDAIANDDRSILDLAEKDGIYINCPPNILSTVRRFFQKHTLKKPISVVNLVPETYTKKDEDKIRWINQNKVALRRYLQWYGTEFRRAQCDSYWTDRVREKIDSPLQRWVISDTRFTNEINMIRNLGGEIWRVDGRDDGYTPKHASEIEWKNHKPDRFLSNGGGIRELINEIRRTLFRR